MADNDDKQRTWAVTFGTVDLVTAGLIFAGVFLGLPTRWWPVDACAAVLIALFAAAGAGLLAGTPWAARVARAASFVSLTVGLLLVTALAFTAFFLSGIYGPVGRGGALILTLVAALALPYLIAFPAAALVWLGPARKAPSAQPAQPAPAPERS